MTVFVRKSQNIAILCNCLRLLSTDTITIFVTIFIFLKRGVIRGFLPKYRLKKSAGFGMMMA